MNGAITKPGTMGLAVVEMTEAAIKTRRRCCLFWKTGEVFGEYIGGTGCGSGGRPCPSFNIGKLPLNAALVSSPRQQQSISVVEKISVLDFFTADVVMAIVADFMLVWLPDPIISLRPPLAVSTGAITKFFQNCPDNAFHVVLAGHSYSLLQTVSSIMRNGAKLFAVGTTASRQDRKLTNPWLVYGENGRIFSRKFLQQQFFFVSAPFTFPYDSG